MFFRYLSLNYLQVFNLQECATTFQILVLKQHLCANKNNHSTRQIILLLVRLPHQISLISTRKPVISIFFSTATSSTFSSPTLLIKNPNQSLIALFARSSFPRKNILQTAADLLIKHLVYMARDVESSKKQISEEGY